LVPLVNIAAAPPRHPITQIFSCPAGASSPQAPAGPFRLASAINSSDDRRPVPPMTSPADWQDFAEMIGGASGALTGLLFVAVSLNATRIAGHQGLRASATQTLVLFLVPLVIAAALLTPDQPDWVLGAELIVI